MCRRAYGSAHFASPAPDSVRQLEFSRRIAVPIADHLAGCRSAEILALHGVLLPVSCVSPSPPPGAHGAHNRLPTLIYRHVLDRDALLPFAAVPIQRFQL